MPREVKSGSVRERILRFLGARYPATLDDVTLALSLRPDVARLEVRRLRAQGLVVVETPGGKVHVALSGEGFRVVGMSPSAAASLRKRGKLPPASPRPEDDPAFT